MELTDFHLLAENGNGKQKFFPWSAIDKWLSTIAGAANMPIMPTSRKQGKY
jgi:hypothetical protein